MTFGQRIALNGEYSEGFNTMVQPAASAGTTFAATWFIGQFHGVISAHTPDRLLDQPRRAAQLFELEGLQDLDHGADVSHPDAGLRTFGERDGRAHLGPDRLGDLVVMSIIRPENALEQGEALGGAVCE